MASKNELPVYCGGVDDAKLYRYTKPRQYGGVASSLLNEIIALVVLFPLVTVAELYAV